MVVSYSPDPESYFSLIDFFLRTEARDISYHCERPWKNRISQPDLFGCAEPDPRYDASDIRVLARSDRAIELRSDLARLAPCSEQDLLYAFLSEEPIEGRIMEYARLALAGDIERIHDETDETVRTVLATARRVNKEIHAFQGILRFSETPSGVFEAFFEPDADIVLALYPFFKARFGSTRFRIIDAIRSRCVGEPRETEKPPEYDEWKSLWKVFYKSTENPLRFNPKLRLQHMPRRYWKYLPEVNDEG
jgi:probable DNA metabolism protein